MSLLELHDIVKLFPVRRGFFGRAREFVHAVNGVSMEVYKGESVGLVGESGCGKSTIGRIAVGLYRPTSGKVLFDGVDLNRESKETVRKLRGSMQVVFQDPFSSLNPRMSIKDIITEPILVHKTKGRKECQEKASALLRKVNIDPDVLDRYPHEFSGGQRQRISIARAIALEPKLILLDEPVSSLDVAIQADILELLKKLQQELKVAYLFISHDLRVVSSLCNRVAVMYLGKIVELMPAKDVKVARHPYTRALVSSVPLADPTIKKGRVVLKGDVPSTVHIPRGCPFHPRCLYKEDICEKEAPVLELRPNGHKIACHFWDKD